MIERRSNQKKNKVGKSNYRKWHLKNPNVEGMKEESIPCVWIHEEIQPVRTYT